MTRRPAGDRLEAYPTLRRRLVAWGSWRHAQDALDRSLDTPDSLISVVQTFRLNGDTPVRALRSFIALVSISLLFAHPAQAAPAAFDSARDNRYRTSAAIFLCLACWRQLGHNPQLQWPDKHRYFDRF
jgi:hypothetical protein